MALTLICNEEGCTCKKCIEMCKTYACLPTPLEAEILINAGYGDRLMLDTRPSTKDGKLLILTLMPAMKGFERRISPMQIGISDCVFLENDRCQLHDLGLKPFEGRVARHDTTEDDDKKMMDLLKRMWASQEGRRIVDMWTDKYLHIDCK